MQRKKYRDYSDTVELGNALQFVPVSQMRKFTMTRLIKVIVLLIVGYIIASVYMKHRIAKSKFTENMEIPKVNADENVKKENENVKPHDIRLKEQVNQVFEEFKRKQEEKEKRDVFEEQIAQDILNKDRNEIPNDDIRVEENENKINVEVVDNINDIEEDDPAEFIKVDINAQNIDRPNFNDGNDDIIENEKENKELNENELELEIEHRLADAIRDAANEVADEKQDILENAAQAENNDVANIEPQDVEAILEKEEFKDTARNIGHELNPEEIEHIIQHKGNLDYDHEFPPFVTAARQSTFNAVLQLISSIQAYMPNMKVYVFDLDLDNEQQKTLISLCNVHRMHFMKELFPRHVSDLDNYHWKPLVIQMALAELSHITWVNPGLVLTTQKFGMSLHQSHENGILVLSQPAVYTTFAATHPDMYNFLSTNKEKLAWAKHQEIQAIMIHNTDEIHENIMKLFTACAIEETCLAPLGAQWRCSFDFTGRRYAGCHRYDESALNILLNNMFNFDSSRFARSSYSMFRKSDASGRTPRLKYCRDISDIEL